MGRYYYIRFENLEEDIIKLCKILKIDQFDIKLLPKHKSGYRKYDKHWSKYYEKHKKEFELYGYEFESI